MWWYRSLHRRLLALVRRFAKQPVPDILDAGCGTGGFLRFLSKQFPGAQLTGVEVWPPAATLARVRSGAEVLCGSLNKMPVDNASADVVICADVLCHESVDLPVALGELRRCLRPGGVLILNLPAYEWLRSYHDQRVHTAHRFTARELRGLLADAGIRQVYGTYWNCILFPLAYLQRRVLHDAGAQVSDVRLYPVLLDALFTTALRLEEGLQAMGVRWPFGLSIMVAGCRE